MTLKRSVCALLVSLAMAASAGHAQAGKATKDQAQIRKLLDDFAKAFTARDVGAVMAMYAPDVVSYDVSPPLEYVGVDAYRKDYEGFLGAFQGPIGLEYRDLHIEASGNLGVARGLEHMTGTMTDGQKMDLWIRFTAVFHKVNGRWLDVHDHVSVPTDFATGKAALDLKP